MDPESSPFRPGQPTAVKLFVGRRAEIERLRGLVRGSVEGRLGVGFVSGERGIGKSSLAAYVRRVVEEDGDAVGCHVFLGGVRNVPEMLRLSFNRLLNESIGRPWHEKLKEYFGSHVRRVGAFGVSLELRFSDADISTVQHDFVPSIRRLLDRLRDQKRCLLLVLDDIDSLARSADFANWLKSSVDEIATSEQPTRLCILIVGLEERRAELIARQPSLARVFDLIDLAPWSDDDARDFYRNSFALAEASLGERQLDYLVGLAGGLPTLAHEIGSALWREFATGGTRGSTIERGVAAAAETVGRKLMDAIRSERYRSIVYRVSRERSNRFTRAELVHRLPANEQNVLDNFLRRLKKLGAFRSDPNVKGGYRFASPLHAHYFHNIYAEQHTRQR